MTTADFRASIQASRDRAGLGTSQVPTGRSYIVSALSADLAPFTARIEAARQGHRGARWARILHVERIDTGIYEVVIEAR